MSKCNGYCSSDSDEENMIEEHLVDSLPNSAINLLYYIEPHTIYHLQPHIYYIDDIYLYTRYTHTQGTRLVGVGTPPKLYAHNNGSH